MMSVAESLRKIRKSHNLTQADVARVLGIDRTTYTLYELGTTFPSIASLIKLADAYNASVGYIIGKELNNNPDRLIKDADYIREDNIDPLALLSKDERSLLFSYRTLAEDEKKRIKQDVLNSVGKK